MKEQVVKGLEMIVPEGKAFAVETPTHLPKLHMLSAFVGKRGSGKGVAMTTLLKRLKQSGCMDRILCISPTFKSNKRMLKDLEIDENDIYDDLDNDACITDIIKKVEKEAEEYEKYLEDMKQYNKFQKIMKTDNHISDEMLLEFFDGAGFKKPEHKWNGKKPVIGLILDDAQSTAVMRSKKLANLCIKHRHVGMFNGKEGGALGLSIFMCLQNYKTQSGFPRGIRGNLTHLGLFKSKDEAELKDVASEMSGEVDEETFRQVYKQATDEEHSFLWVDLHPKKDVPSGFRKRFDTYLVPSLEKFSNTTIKDDKY